MGWFRRFAATVSGSTLDRNLSDETQHHLDALIDEYMSRGFERGQATREARRRLGNVPVIHEQLRDVDTVRWLADFGRDARFGVRLLRRSPGFTVAVRPAIVVLFAAATLLLLTATANVAEPPSCARSHATA
jgi:hypothetical protein